MTIYINTWKYLKNNVLEFSLIWRGVQFSNRSGKMCCGHGMGSFCASWWRETDCCWGTNYWKAPSPRLALHRFASPPAGEWVFALGVIIGGINFWLESWAAGGCSVLFCSVGLVNHCGGWVRVQTFTPRTLPRRTGKRRQRRIWGISTRHIPADAEKSYRSFNVFGAWASADGPGRQAGRQAPLTLEHCLAILLGSHPSFFQAQIVVLPLLLDLPLGLSFDAGELRLLPELCFVLQSFPGNSQTKGEPFVRHWTNSSGKAALGGYVCFGMKGFSCKIPLLLPEKRNTSRQGFVKKKVEKWKSGRSGENGKIGK